MCQGPCCTYSIAASSASQVRLLLLRHNVIALLRMRHCCVCTYCVCSTPNFQAAYAAFVTLSLGGLDGGSQWVILFHLKTINIGVPYYLKFMLSPVWIEGGYIRPYTRPLVLQCVYPHRPYKIAGQRYRGFCGYHLLPLHTLSNCCILYLSILYDTPCTG